MPNRRFEMYEYRQTIFHMRAGKSDRQIRDCGLMGRKKASSFRKLAQEQGWLDPSSPAPDDAALAAVLNPADSSSAATMLSLVEPFREEAVAWHDQGLQATTIHSALERKHGFSGSYSSVVRFLKKLDAEAPPEASVMLDFAPGEAAQVDFGAGPKIADPLAGELKSTWFFVMTLAFSRHQYAELVFNQTIATWLKCHRRAFEWFGGVPSKIIIDNPKCAITRACYYDPEIQRSYAACAEGYGFLISPCPPREPKKKGRVESGVKYIKKSFLPLRDFRHLPDANRQLGEWILGPAGNRLHGSTREKPLTRFSEVERVLLRPLPDIPPKLSTWSKAKVHGNCHIQFEKSYYSAPFKYVGEELWLQATDSCVEIYRNHELVALHPRTSKPGEHSTIESHYPPNAVAYLMRDPQWCIKQAKAVGPFCTELVEKLFSNQVLDNLKAAHGVLGLGKRFGALRLEAACRRALSFDEPKYRTVKCILEKGLDQEPEAPQPAALADAYTGKGSFCRDTRQLFLFQDKEI